MNNVRALAHIEETPSADIIFGLSSNLKGPGIIDQKALSNASERQASNHVHKTSDRIFVR
jgi:hypothetical protein